MRIIGGEHRGIRIHLPKSFRARPTTDTAKEGLFNILNNRIFFEDTRVLDLFAGSGGISFEFASRGSCEIVTVEKDFRHCKHILKSIETIGFDSEITVLNTDVFKYLKHSKESFNLVFADPPYDLKTLDEIPELVLTSQLVACEGLFILEHSSAYNFSNHAYFLELRKYGSVHFSFFKKP